MTARKTRVPRRLRERVAETARHRCGYCCTPEHIAGYRLTIEHIIPESAGAEIIGRTSSGRATVATLRLNRPEIVAARSLWVQVGWWPPPVPEDANSSE